MTDDDPIEFYVDPVAMALAELAEHVARLAAMQSGGHYRRHIVSPIVSPHRR
jgi:hypothetical protein